MKHYTSEQIELARDLYISSTDPVDPIRDLARKVLAGVLSEGGVGDPKAKWCEVDVVRDGRSTRVEVLCRAVDSGSFIP